MFEASRSRRPWIATVGWKRPKPPRHGLLAAADAPGEADPRAEVVVVRVQQRVGEAEVARQPDALELLKAGGEPGQHLLVRHHMVAALLGDEVPEDVALLVPGPHQLVPQSQEERHVFVEPPVVLKEHREVVGVAVSGATGSHPVGDVTGEAEQEIAECAAGPRAAEPVLPAVVQPASAAVDRAVARPQDAPAQ
jgi:hypothetical protein